MRKLFFIALALMTTQMVLAQSKLSARIGISTLRMKSTDPFRNYQKLHAGVQLGFGYQLPLNDAFSIRPEFVISQNTLSEGSVGTDLKIGYYNVPVLLNYCDKESGANLFVGPQMSFINGATIVNKGTGATSGRGSSMNETDFGITYGICSTPTKKGYFFDLRAYNGLSQVLKTTYDNGLKSSYFGASFSVGYRFK